MGLGDLVQLWPPDDAPFRPADLVPWCWRTGLPSDWNNFVGFWSVQPETRWMALDEVEARLPQTAQPIAGTPRDQNAACGFGPHLGPRPQLGLPASVVDTPS